MTCDGDREVLGLWWQETEGAKFWLSLLNDLRRRGVGDVLIACVDGLKGFPEAIEATFPTHGFRPASSTSSAPVCATSIPRQAPGRRRVAPDLHRRKRRPGALRARTLRRSVGRRYPATVNAWRACWKHVTPFLALPDELRRAVYTTNTIEGVHRQIRKAIKTRGHFPDEQAATKLIYLAILKADGRGTKRTAPGPLLAPP